MGKRTFLNVCESCNGFSADEEQTECPVCGGEMVFKPIDAKDKAKYRNLDDIEDDFADIDDLPGDESDDNSSSGSYGRSQSKTTPKSKTKGSDGSYDDDEDDDVSVTSLAKPSSKKIQIAAGRSSGTVSYSGIVFNYNNSDRDSSNYSRLLITRIMDAIIYKQRMEDVLHYFRLYTDSGKDSDGMAVGENINVNIHGTIVGGAHINDNSNVSVRGKMKNGVLMASDIVDNDSGSHIRFRRSYKMIAAMITLALILVISFIFCGVNTPSKEEFWHTIGKFFGIFLGMYAAFVIICLVTSFSKFGIIAKIVSGQNKKGLPWIPLLIIAFAATILLIIALPEIIGGLIILKGSIIEILEMCLMVAILIGGIIMIIKSVF